MGRERVSRVKLIKGKVARAALWLGVAAAVPCLAQGLAQGKGFREPPQQKRQEEKGNRPQAGRAQPGHAGDWLRRYKDMSPAEQQRALQNDPQFHRLSPERQQQLQQRLQHFSTLPSEQQQRVLNRMETWEHLTPPQKQQAREIFGQLQRLPSERRRMVTSAMRDLRAMPPEQREQVIDSERFKGMFSPPERELLRGTSKLPLAPPENGKGEEGPPEE
jgi:hypothetical protein